MAQVPDTMRAVVAPKGGGPEVLSLGDVPDREPGPGEIRVRIAVKRDTPILQGTAATILGSFTGPSSVVLTR